MGADATGNSNDPNTIQWRRDGSTSTAVRLCWSLGVGTFFAAISIVALWRVYDFAGQAWPQLQPLILALLGALAVTVIAIAVVKDSTGRAVDAAVGTVVMAGIIVALMLAGRVAEGSAALGPLGASPFTAMATLLMPFAFVALVLSSFLRSAGAVDRDAETLYLSDPDLAIDLETIDRVSVWEVGGVTVLNLRYAQPGGEYVPGPRRLVVPPTIAAEIEAAVDSSR
ncbi:hypothetical protein [Natrialba swarupiae]|uniref:Uncharacterized protein n=1 Tax=Natrialba swarupiae TaxID=2448032 RepID=A0A5D5APT4_9EURY|nr:hypothetical protein [Natrialba swarupiae]TYT63858.1 hypothetical protein FYC77_01170 [Natrialba swarupiae]